MGNTNHTDQILKYSENGMQKIIDYINETLIAEAEEMITKDLKVSEKNEMKRWISVNIKKKIDKFPKYVNKKLKKIIIKIKKKVKKCPRTSKKCIEYGDEIF